MSDLGFVEGSRLETPGRRAVFLSSITLLVLSIVLPLPVWLGGLFTLAGAALVLGLVVHITRTPHSANG